MPKKPTIHILGVGALGSLWATKLSKSNHVTLLLREGLSKKTHRFEFIEEKHSTIISLPCESATITNSTINTLLVFTKSYDALSAIGQLKHRITPATQIVLFQNGMGSQQNVIESLPNHQIYAASTTEARSSI